MFKKNFSHLNNDYNNYLYTGLIGKLMRINHDLMEKNSHFYNENTNVLEIGAGTYPHIIHLKHEYNSYEVIDTDESDLLEEYYKENNFKLNFKKLTVYFFFIFRQLVAGDGFEPPTFRL